MLSPYLSGSVCLFYSSPVTQQLIVHRFLRNYFLDLSDCYFLFIHFQLFTWMVSFLSMYKNIIYIFRDIILCIVEMESVDLIPCVHQLLLNKEVWPKYQYYFCDSYLCNFTLYLYIQKDDLIFFPSLFWKFVSYV